jgi:protein TonB
MRLRNQRLFRTALAAGAAAIAGCAAPPPPSGPAGAEEKPRPSVAAPATADAKSRPQTSYSSETEWRRAMAQHILTVNKARVFEGRPPHPLKAVVVLDIAIAPDGRVQRATVLRAPDHARELGADAIRTVQAASPLPAPPRALAGNGSVRVTETWLFRQDNQFQIRTLAQTQLIQ